MFAETQSRSRCPRLSYGHEVCHPAIAGSQSLLMECTSCSFSTIGFFIISWKRYRKGYEAMKGTILDFTIQTGEGIISGDDNNRYKFAGAEWKAPDAPVRAQRVDFDISEGRACAVYRELSKTVVLRNYWSQATFSKLLATITRSPVTFRANIHDASRPAPIGRALQAARRYDVAVLDPRPTSGLGDQERRDPGTYVGVRSCNDPPMTFRIDRRCDSDSGINQSKHSRRIVPMTRSQIAFAVGLCGGDFSMLRPSALIDSSRCFAKMPSRSWSRYRCFPSSPTTSRNCCSVQSALGCAVTFR